VPVWKDMRMKWEVGKQPEEEVERRREGEVEVEVEAEAEFHATRSNASTQFNCTMQNPKRRILVSQSGVRGGFESPQFAV